MLDESKEDFLFHDAEFTQELFPDNFGGLDEISEEKEVKGVVFGASILNPNTDASRRLFQEKPTEFYKDPKISYENQPNPIENLRN